MMEAHWNETKAIKIGRTICWYDLYTCGMAKQVSENDAPLLFFLKSTSNTSHFVLIA